MRKYIQLLSLAGLLTTQAFAGNPDRAGGAGGTQLLINPYAKSAGLGGANSASVRGGEAFHFNIAGLAYTEKTEISFSRVIYLQGTDVFINNVTLSQALGSSGNVIGLTINSFDFGNIPITSESQPDGTLGTYSPQILNIGLAYSKKFSNSITGGMAVRLVSEGIANVSANGVALDAGVQYQTSLNPKKKDIKKEDFRFGIGVRNIGPNMTYTGSGLSFRSINPVTGADRRALMGSESFNLPALVNIGASYDMRLDNGETYYHKLTAHGNFNYNAFSANVISIGGEYSYREIFALRAAYNWQDGITSATDYRTQYYGISAGAGIKVPISKSGTALGLDYAYAPTRVFNGIHNLTIRLLIGNNK